MKSQTNGLESLNKLLYLSLLSWTIEEHEQGTGREVNK